MQILGNFQEDGVVCIQEALDESTLKLAEKAFAWSLANPGPGAAQLPGNGSGRFYQDLANPGAFSAYDTLIHTADIVAPIRALWGSDNVWFMYEQVFEKAGGETRRTPWHQDTPYLPVEGRDLAVMWISFDVVPANFALEFVKGSHHGTLYDGSRFDPGDDTLPLYGDGSLPRLPDIEANRADYPIVSWATEPGDIVVFHPAILHGGGPTPADFSRRTLSLRFFGDDAVVATRPGTKPRDPETRGFDSSVHPLTRMRSLPAGTPFQDPAFPQLLG